MITNVPVEVVMAMSNISEFCNKYFFCDDCPLYRNDKENKCYIRSKVPSSWEFRVTQVKIGEVGDNDD